MPGARPTQITSAWQRLQAVEDEFDRLPPGSRGSARRALERPRRGARRPGKRLALVAIASILAWLVGGPFYWTAWTADYTTATGERRTVTLADGTELRLNTATAVDVDYAGDRRDIHLLQGEILVTTGDDTGTAAPRRLRVRTDNGVLIPVGTRFLVRRHAERTRLQVLVGTVAMRPAAKTRGQRVIAQAGDIYIMDDQHTRRVKSSHLDASAWLDGALMVHNMRLADVLAELDRYRHGWLHCDPAVADLEVSGVFQLDDIDGALRALADHLPLRIERFTPYWVQITAAEQGP